jgi:outer membrane biosynthesis protein TonB
MRRVPILLALSALALSACGRERAADAPRPDAAAAFAPSAGASPPTAPSGPGRPTSGARSTAPAPPAPPPPLCSDPGAGPEPDGAVLQAFVRRRTTPIRVCYDRALKRDASLRGRVVVRFTIGTCGEIADLALTGGHGRAAPELAACVTRAVKGWRLPFRPSEPVDVEYPFRFTAG